MSPGAIPSSATSAWRPSITPDAGSAGIVGDLKPVSCPVSSFSRLKSVNVPPMSMPSRYRGTTTSSSRARGVMMKAERRAAYRGASRWSTPRARNPGGLAPENEREEEDAEDQRQETPAGRGPRDVRARIAAVHLLARGVHLELGPVLAPADHGPESLVGRGLGLGPLERDGERGLRREPERERAPVRQRL